MGMPRMFKAMFIEAHRRRRRIRTAVITLCNEGMCRHVQPRIVMPDTFGGRLNVDMRELRIEYVHGCGDACPWLEARRIVDEQIAAW